MPRLNERPTSRKTLHFRGKDCGNSRQLRREDARAAGEPAIGTPCNAKGIFIACDAALKPEIGGMVKNNPPDFTPAGVIGFSFSSAFCRCLVSETVFESENTFSISGAC
jgi:hypothetical protein